MTIPFRDLTKTETEEFVKENICGILAFAGDEPYAIPIGYFYRKGTFILALAGTGRKTDYLRKNRKVCFTICKPRWQTPDLKEPCTTVVVEGELEEVTDRTYYGLSAVVSEAYAEFKPTTFRIKVNRVGAKVCTMEPCELFAEPWVSAEAYARRLHEPQKASK